MPPVKDSHASTSTGIKPLALASGHGRYITVTPERKALVELYVRLGMGMAAVLIIFSI
jgi:hypothetical protein